MSNIKLAIRLRPFSDRELKSEKDSTPVVEVIDDNSVAITNIKVSASGAGDSRERVRCYQADYTYDSACHSDSPKYASQDKIFDTMGRDVLDCLMRGSSACVLAYGQSATGKTHTMMGNDVQPGLIPRLCSALAASDLKEITVSFLEIYNERVHDLLVSEEPVSEYHSLPRRRGNTRKDLRVREHPERGPYVQNLRRVVVHDPEALHALVSEGARRRCTAATRRNATSSRSHALLELSTADATLHLADLAGSEKASWEGCGGGRQKEGSNINKSLVALSNVISALVSSGSGRGKFVPYRDSALTWLLKDCFTGGGAAFIIATVSPSVACYGESASTLRWASRARQLKISPHLRSSSIQSTRLVLQRQLQQLIAELAKHYIQYNITTGTLLYDKKHWTLNEENDAKKKVDLENLKMNPLKGKVSENHNSESTASSVASGSSDHIVNVERQKKLTNEINKEVDKLFGPALERTHSGSDLKVVAPLRHKRRQYRSQEVLPFDSKSNQNINLTNRKVSLQEIGLNQVKTEVDNLVNEAQETKPQHVPITYDNSQRAEIVASVTERLYSKLKKKEEAALSKVENVVDKKIMEPLSELKICTNARQRLVELSQKAMKNKRRIGIPAYTQTRFRVTRVKDQGTDVQTDLEPFAIKERNVFTYHHNVGTETTPTTPRCKDISVGPSCGSLHRQDNSTLTERKRISVKTCSVMTETCDHCDRSTQTNIPSRRKKVAPSIPKYVGSAGNTYDEVLSPVISINIVQSYPKESDSTSASDDSLENVDIKPKCQNLPTTPDLLTNHSAIDPNNVDASTENNSRCNPKQVVKTNTKNVFSNKSNSDADRGSGDIFSDGEEYLPRITVNPSTSSARSDIKNMILGRNENAYPYNIVLSPPKVRPESNKRTVKFKDLEAPSLVNVASQTSQEAESVSSNVESNERNSDNETESNKSDSTNSGSSNIRLANNFVWRKGAPSNGYNANSINGFFLNQNVYSPVYNNIPTARYNTAKTKIYREFLGLEQNSNKVNNYTDEKNKFSKFAKDIIYESDEENGVNEFRQKRDFFESKGPSIFNQTKDPFCDFEKKLLKSCDRLDASINKYDDYLKGYRERTHQLLAPRRLHSPAREFSHVKPRDYLNHLVEVRKNVVQGNISSGNVSSGSVF